MKRGIVALRAEDGRWYYAEIKSVKRVDASPLAAGGRVAVLGVEGARPYELNAIAIGSGDAASLAMALTPPPPAVAPAPKPQAATPPAPIAAVHPEPAASAPPDAETPRWSAMQGLVRAVEGNSMVVKTAEGKLVIVDVSAIALAASSIKPGTAITVYGTPGELRFQAVELVEPKKRPLARPTSVPPRRGHASQN